MASYGQRMVKDAGRIPRLHSVSRIPGKTTLDVCAASLPLGYLPSTFPSTAYLCLLGFFLCVCKTPVERKNILKKNVRTLW